MITYFFQKIVWSYLFSPATNISATVTKLKMTSKTHCQKEMAITMPSSLKTRELISYGV